MIARNDLRLFLSYQRYCALVLVASAACAGGAALAFTRLDSWLRWPACAIASVCALTCLRFAWFIGSHYPRKRRATRLALRRIEMGRFRTESLARYCEDPCYRVVAKEILRHTALGRLEQAEVFRQLVAKSREPAFLIFVDPTAEQGVRVHCEL